MIDTIFDAKQYSAGMITTALACPVGAPATQRSVGPFALLAHALPLEVAPGELPPDFDVRPHPHIGLAAVTYLLAGHSTHRDSLGSRRETGPGGVNYMIAGRGIVHSERFERLRTLGGRLELLQILMALPDGAEDLEPSFTHLPPERVPELRESGAIVRCLAGAGTSLDFPAPMFLHDVQLAAGGHYDPPPDMPERAIYVVAGAVEIGGTRVGERQTATLAPAPARVTAAAPTRVISFGGEPVGARYVWWNFLHSSLARIEEAKAAWRDGSTPLPPGDTESFTPAPAPSDGGRPLLRLNGAPAVTHGDGPSAPT